VKEYYFYLDSTPTHSYMKYLYKYPQAAFPYDDLVAGNRQRGRNDFEYELLDTGVFAQDRYFDVFVEYAKAAPEDILVAITVHNRGPDPATLHVLPTLWFRNTWSWGGNEPRPSLRQTSAVTIAALHPELHEVHLCCEGAAELLFTENETNSERLFGTPNRTPYVKDGIDGRVVTAGRMRSIRSTRGPRPQRGTRSPWRGRIGHRAAAAHRNAEPEGGKRLRCGDGGAAPRGRRVLRFRDPAFVRRRSRLGHAPGAGGNAVVEAVLLLRRRPLARGARRRSVQWKTDSAPRNNRWHHMYNAHILSMPDKWEYPWYAAWDLAFHVLALTLVDEDFGKEQLDLMVAEQYCTRAGSFPRTNGTSATSIRRCTPTRRSSPTVWKQRTGAAATSSGSSARSTSC
jgi:hypothetical protein